MCSRRILSGLIACGVFVAAATSLTSQTERLAITGVNVVDVVTGSTFPNSTVVIDGPTITAVGSGVTPPATARVIDGTGTFLIPGLWDMHAHLQMTGESSLQLYVANGVTGVRDMGADLDFILGLRDATKSRRIFGPEIIAAGPILDDAPGDWPLRMRVQSADQGREAVRLLKRRGVDLIKVHNFTPRDAFLPLRTRPVARISRWLAMCP